MCSQFLRFFAILAWSVLVLSWGSRVDAQDAPKNGGDFSDNARPESKVPEGVILVKGAWSSASDSVTPVPEGGNVANNVFSDQYFGMSYTLPLDWEE